MRIKLPRSKKYFLISTLFVIYLLIYYLNGLAGKKLRFQNLPIPTFLLSQPELVDYDIVTTIVGQKKIIVNHLNLGDGTEQITSLSLSPDRQKICFTTQSGRDHTLYWTSWNGIGNTVIGPGVDCRWSPDSQKIAYRWPKTFGHSIGCYWLDSELNLNLTTRREDRMRDYQIPIWSLNNIELFAQFENLSSNPEAIKSGIIVVDITSRIINDK